MNEKMKIIGLTLITLTLITSIPIVFTSQPLTVGTGKRFLTISEAVDAAKHFVVKKCHWLVGAATEKMTVGHRPLQKRIC